MLLDPEIETSPSNLGVLSDQPKEDNTVTTLPHKHFLKERGVAIWKKKRKKNPPLLLH